MAKVFTEAELVEWCNKVRMAAYNEAQILLVAAGHMEAAAILADLAEKAADPDEFKRAA